MKLSKNPWTLWILWFLIMLLFPLAALTPRSRGQNPGSGYGTNVASSAGFQLTAEMGFEWVRIYFPEQVDEAERHGLKVLLLLGWEDPLTDVQSWGDDVYDIVHRYRGRVAAYQICNEPNLAEMWHKPRYADPAEYVSFLREAYLRAKEADPNCIIVSAGLAVNGGMGELAMDDVQFLRGMYAAGAKPYFDVLGSHPYGFGYAPEDATSNPTHCFRRVEQQRAVMVQYGDGAKPIWATEVGWILEPPAWCSDFGGWPGWWWQRVSEQTQADYLVRAYRYARTNWPWMDVMFVWNMDYNLVPWNEYCEPIGWFAIVNHAGAPRSAYWELARLPKSDPTPTSMPSPTATVTSAPRPSPTTTAAPGTGSISGRVLLQGRSDHRGAVVSGGGRSAETRSNGGFRLDGVPTGRRQVRVEMAGYLRHSLLDIEVRADQVSTLPDIELLAGDANDDEIVNLFDLVAVASRYGLAGPAYAEDINGDGEVNLFDLVLVGSNYGVSA
jgi:hypothetical protein